MTGVDKFERIMRDRTSRIVKKEQQLSGFLGIRTGGENVVDIPGRPGFVWVRLRNVTNEVIQAFNDKVSPVYNLPVIVERDSTSPIRYKIVSRDTDIYGSNWGTASAYMPGHGAQHSFDKTNTNTGGDVTWIFSDQFTPNLVIPSGSAGSANVLIWPYVYHDDDGNYHYAGNTGTASLLGNKPTGSSNARMSLIYIDVSTGNPSILAGTTEFAATVTGTAGVLPYIPSVPDDDDIALAGVRLVSGTSKIFWSNLYDIRELIHKHPQADGAVGGGGDLVIYDDSVYKVTGSAISFDDNLDVHVTGSVAYIEGQAGSQGPPGEPGGILVYDDSVFQVTGTAISFNETLGVAVTGSHAYVGVLGEGARVYNSGNITIATATPTVLTFDSERYDTDNIHDTATGTYSRLTCQTSGKYIIVGGLTWASNATGYRRVDIRLNGSILLAFWQVKADNTPANIRQVVTTIYNMSISDYVEFRAYQNSGGNLNVEVGGNHSPEFMMQRIG